jgi:hypothetical protein
VRQASCTIRPIYFHLTANVKRHPFSKDRRLVISLKFDPVCDVPVLQTCRVLANSPHGVITAAPPPDIDEIRYRGSQRALTYPRLTLTYFLTCVNLQHPSI